MHKVMNQMVMDQDERLQLAKNLADTLAKQEKPNRLVFGTKCPASYDNGDVLINIPKLSIPTEVIQ